MLMCLGEAFADVHPPPTMEFNVEASRPGRFILRDCFGGIDGGYVAGSTEVSRIQILQTAEQGCSVQPHQDHADAPQTQMHHVLHPR